jgi:hypothetical protein
MIPLVLRLWHPLHYPSRAHPYFRYLVAQTPPSIQATATLFLWLMLLLSPGVCLAITPAFHWLPWAFFALLLGLNTLLGLFWVLSISTTITHEVQHKRYELLAALPNGMIGASWILCTEHLHHLASFRYWRVLARTLALALVLMHIGGLLLTALVLQSDFLSETALVANEQLVSLFVALLVAAVIFYVDYRYTLLSAALIGMLSPTDALSTDEARLNALRVYVPCQLLPYGGVLLWVSALWGGFLFGVALLPLVLIGGVSLVVLFGVLREGALRWIWWQVGRQLAVDTPDWAQWR